jgi:hypothetical protein
MRPLYSRREILALLGSALVAVPRAVADAPPRFHLDQLACMSWCELEALYRAATPGPIPCGFVHGRAFYCPGTKRLKAKVAKFAWRGKVFDSCGSSMINQWPGFRAIRGSVYEGESFLDGKPSTFLDYRGTARVWQDVHDEFRALCPGVWLGIMYRRTCPQPTLETYFALESPCGG